VDRIRRSQTLPGPKFGGTKVLRHPGIEHSELLERVAIVVSKSQVVVAKRSDKTLEHDQGRDGDDLLARVCQALTNPDPPS